MKGSESQDPETPVIVFEHDGATHSEAGLPAADSALELAMQIGAAAQGITMTLRPEVQLTVTRRRFRMGLTIGFTSVPFVYNPTRDEGSTQGPQTNDRLHQLFGTLRLGRQFGSAMEAAVGVGAQRFWLANADNRKGVVLHADLAVRFFPMGRYRSWAPYFFGELNGRTNRLTLRSGNNTALSLPPDPMVGHWSQTQTGAGAPDIDRRQQHSRPGVGCGR